MRARRLLAFGGLLAMVVLAVPQAATASGNPWNVVPGSIGASQVTGGFWTLGQSASPAHQATMGSQINGMCSSGTSLTSHVGTDLMQPYYFPFTVGTDQTMTGYFDYRVKDKEELVATGTSMDGGKTWTINGTAYQLNDGNCNGAGSPTPAKVTPRSSMSVG